VSNWRPIAEAEKGIGPVLLRCGSDPSDPVFVGAQSPDTGQWFYNGLEVRPAPTYFAPVPYFDFDEGR
jgi:hypothetical protein